MSRPFCPECEVGKHLNCVQTAWDDVTDSPIPCACPDPSHDPFGGNP